MTNAPLLSASFLPSTSDVAAESMLTGAGSFSYGVFFLRSLFIRHKHVLLTLLSVTDSFSGAELT